MTADFSAWQEVADQASTGDFIISSLIIVSIIALVVGAFAVNKGRILVSIVSVLVFFLSFVTATTVKMPKAPSLNQSLEYVYGLSSIECKHKEYSDTDETIPTTKGILHSTRRGEYTVDSMKDIENGVDAECSVYTKDNKHVNVVIHKTGNGNYCVYNQTDGKPLPLKHKKAPTKLSELEK